MTPTRADSAAPAVPATTAIVVMAPSRRAVDQVAQVVAEAVPVVGASVPCDYWVFASCIRRIASAIFCRRATFA